MEINKKELLTFIIIISVIIAFISNEDRKLTLLVIASGVVGGIIANVINDAYLRDWIFSNS